MVPQSWQLIDAECHVCHCWRDVTESIITAMTILPFLITVLAILATAFAVFSLVHLVATDGLGLARRTPPRSHHADMFEPHSFA